MTGLQRSEASVMCWSVKDLNTKEWHDFPESLSRMRKKIEPSKKNFATRNLPSHIVNLFLPRPNCLQFLLPSSETSSIFLVVDADLNPSFGLIPPL